MCMVFLGYSEILEIQEKAVRNTKRLQEPLEY